MNIPENLYLEFDAFLRSIKQNLDGSFGVLLGAGASISSGIQSANDCIWDWKFLIYQSLSGNQKKLVDPKKSDLSKDIIQKWLDVQGKYPQLGSPEEYSFYAEASYPIDADRTKYFESLCNGKSPYVYLYIFSPVLCFCYCHTCIENLKDQYLLYPASFPQ